MSSSDAKIPFTKQLRNATKSVHDTSDKLVNLKLGVALSEDTVWAEGLLVFYEVFKFLELAVDRHADSLLGDYALVRGLWRTEAIEADLGHFLGEGWNSDGRYEVRPAVRDYVQHLETVEKENPYLLVAYMYHLYMGLLSGGQVPI